MAKLAICNVGCKGSTLSTSFVKTNFLITLSLFFESGQSSQTKGMTDKETEYWLGIDLGTTSVKVVLLDLDGNVLCSKSKQTCADVESDEGDCGYEQDPSKIMEVTEDVISTVIYPYKENVKGNK